MKSPFTTCELEAVKLGIQFEEKGLKLYTDMSNEASHPVEKNFTLNWQMRKGLTEMVNEKKPIENSRR